MKNVVLAVFLLLGAFSLSAQDVVGLWKTIDDETEEPKSIIKLYVKNDMLYGKISKIFIEKGENPNPTCDECKGSKKGQYIKGMEILEGMVKNDDEYSGGTILDPETGKVYDCKIWLEDGNLKVRGYIGPFFRTQEWIRVE